VGRQWSQVARFSLYIAVLALLFIEPLCRLMVYAAHNDLNSHIILVPFISAYLVYLRRGRRINPSGPSLIGTVAAAVIGIAAVAAAIEFRATLTLNDGLSLWALAFVTFVAAGAFLFFGPQAWTAFPLWFLIFMIPLPEMAVNWLEKVSVLASADAAAIYFDLTGTPVARNGTVFELPGIVLRVAQECSGIRSSCVLFIASLIASYVFLQTRWRRIVLVALVIPLGVLRNGFRILVIGLLCVHVGPHMIDSPIHHRGGPIFFALSLIPLFLLTFWLRCQERRQPA